MIELEIKNWLQKDEDYEEVSEDGNFRMICNVNRDSFEEYDLEKWRDGKIYTFESLREVYNLLDSFDITVKDEVQTEWDWVTLVTDLHIDPNYDNRLIFEINAYYDWCD